MAITVRRAALYVRLSTANRATSNQAVFEQNPEVKERPSRQLAEQRGWSVVKVYSDRMSGAKADRPGLKALMQDAVVALSMWSWCGSLTGSPLAFEQLVLALAEFWTLGIDFVSSQEALDTSTPMGKAMFTIEAPLPSWNVTSPASGSWPDWSTPGAAGPRAVSESAGRQLYSTACAWWNCATLAHSSVQKPPARETARCKTTASGVLVAHVKTICSLPSV